MHFLNKLIISEKQSLISKMYFNLLYFLDYTYIICIIINLQITTFGNFYLQID